MTWLALLVIGTVIGALLLRGIAFVVFHSVNSSHVEAQVEAQELDYTVLAIISMGLVYWLSGDTEVLWRQVFLSVLFLTVFLVCCSVFAKILIAMIQERKEVESG